MATDKSHPPIADNRPTAPARRQACPVCGRPSREADATFCSPRCADVDLHRWLGGAYRIPGETAIDGTDESEPEDPAVR